MRIRHYLLTGVGLAVLLTACHTEDDSLAIQLMDRGQREGALAKLGPDSLPKLLLWTKAPPPVADPWELNVGLAEAFVRVPTEEAIPFLLSHIDISIYGEVSFAPWLKSPEHIRQTFPSIRALIALGAKSQRPLIRGLENGEFAGEGKLCAIFALARTGRSHEVLEFLQNIHATGQEDLWRAQAIAVQTGKAIERDGSLIPPDE